VRSFDGTLQPLLSAFVYLNTATNICGFGAATHLNSFIFVHFLLVRKIELSYLCNQFGQGNVVKVGNSARCCKPV
jgi:hypothetical protein